MTLSPSRLVRVLVVVVAVECAVALVARSTSAWQIFNDQGRAGRLPGHGRPGVGDRARRVGAAGQPHGAGPRPAGHHPGRPPRGHRRPAQRLSGIAHRTERLLAEPANLRVALQPIVDLETGAWVAVEALARFPDNRPPDQWFTEAHEAGIGIPLERLALERALETLPFLPPGISLSVNASPSMVLDQRPGRADGASRRRRGSGWSRRSPSMRRSRATRRSGRRCCRTGSTA